MPQCSAWWEAVVSTLLRECLVAVIGGVCTGLVMLAALLVGLGGRHLDQHPLDLGMTIERSAFVPPQHGTAELVLVVMSRPLTTVTPTSSARPRSDGAVHWVSVAATADRPPQTPATGGSCRPPPPSAGEQWL
jgi:Mg/Co/Ni transporter MgtE